MVYPVRNKTEEMPRGCFRQPVSDGVYLFIGQDNPAKELALNKIKQKYLTEDLEQFNLDVVYASDAKLKTIQEKFLNLPVNSGRRVVVIKGAHSLDKQTKDFILRHIRRTHKHLILVLDFERYDPKDIFLEEASRSARVVRFKEAPQNDTFSLGRQIESGATAKALGVLAELLKGGEPPERIIGGLRYIWEKQGLSLAQKQGWLELLLACDLEIKKGRLKPAFALEKLVIGLCAFVKPEH